MSSRNKLLLDLQPYLKDPMYARNVAEIVLNAACHPPRSLMALMVSEVAGKFDASHPEIFRMMLREYARDAWKMELR